MKKIIIVVLAIVVVGGVIWALKSSPAGEGPLKPADNQVTDLIPTDDISNGVGAGETGPVTDPKQTVIGQSVEGREIIAYHYPPRVADEAAKKELLFIGGIHGGYSWNTVLVAYELMDYLEQDPNIIPANVRVTVIPVLNPDGLNKVVGTTTGNFTAANVSVNAANVKSGRFNANNVDLNRNFDCDWQAEGVWQNTKVSGGTVAFSEPESAALQKYIEGQPPAAVVVWYSAAGGVFASNCHDGILPATAELTTLYADAAGYKEYQSFDFYKVTGDLVNWLAKQKIPAISVLLATHEDIEWTKNQAGVEALLRHYTQAE